jgi:FtsP/CotA-like multicopper oxidase with cupredoxin domain
MVTRRELLAAGAVVGALSPRARAAQEATHPSASGAPQSTATSTFTSHDGPPLAVPDGAVLPFTVRDGVKVMHLVAEEVEHTFCDGLKGLCWGYNGRTPGPVIEAVEGDRLRIYVTNKLPEPTTVHWHGVRLPNGMDGVAGLTQKPIRVGETFKYEFTVEQPGTFMYHPHYDEMTQMAMGMMGMFVVHPKKRASTEPRVDRDFCLMLSEWSITPGTKRPNPLAMSEFNVLTFNSKAFPGTSPLVVKKGDRVRLRLGNLSAMSHHAMHLHAFPMTLVATDGGVVPPSARHPETTWLVPVGTVRVVEFVADLEGDWSFHCHMTHHGMNQMGHGLPSLIGADVADLGQRLQRLHPSTMLMGEAGMGGMMHMFDMGMKMPENSVPMLGGKGPFDHIEMGGMFTIVKVRSPEHFGDVWHTHPAGTVASRASDDDLARDGIVIR